MAGVFSALFSCNHHTREMNFICVMDEFYMDMIKKGKWFFRHNKRRVVNWELS